MRVLFISVCAAVLGVSIAGAQPTMRKEPARYTVPDRVSRVKARPPGMRLGLRQPREFALASLSGTEQARLTEPGTRLKVGVRRTLGTDALASGIWETAVDGTRLWRMAIRSPG